MAEDICPDCHSELRLDGSCPMCDPEGRIPWDDDEDEDGGWALDQTHSDSLWDNADDDENARA